MAAVHTLNPEVARKIAAGEVIDRPAAIIRELMDNAVDSGATKIEVEIESGGIEKIRVIDNGCGMTREDLHNCARPHATSKISTETDLLKLTTLGFRGEALSSMAAVSRLQIISGGYKMNASVTEDHIIEPYPSAGGCIVQTAGLFENFPARRQFLKRPASEGVLCRSIFEEKVLPRPDIAFTFRSDGEEKLTLPATESLTSRFIQTMEFFETEDLFYELKGRDEENNYSFTLVIGEPSVCRSNRKNIYIYVNGRRINDYSLMQAIEYGCEGCFPNGTHPVACLFVTMNPALVDFNIHPAKREARFKDTGPLHHSISTTVKNFYRQYTVKNLVNAASSDEDSQIELYDISHSKPSFVSHYMPPPTSGHSSLSSGFSGSSYGSVPRTEDRRSSFFSPAQKTASPLESAYLEKAEPEAEVIPESVSRNFLQEEGDDDSFHFAGSVLGTFLLAQKDDALYIIDQHAAHERIIYNRIIEEAGQKQNLMVPYAITTSSDSEDKYLEAITDSLDKAGFSIKKVSEGKWEVNTVPVRWKGTEEELQKDLLSKRINPEDILNATAASTACRSAVMDGTVLDRKTAADLAKKALELPDPHCPHGRPVYTVITKAQLFALVKRT